VVVWLKDAGRGAQQSGDPVIGRSGDLKIKTGSQNLTTDDTDRSGDIAVIA
jgi:hypothetical protein